MRCFAVRFLTYQLNNNLNETMTTLKYNSILKSIACLTSRKAVSPHVVGIRTIYSSLYDATCFQSNADYRREEYTAREFGYRVVMSSPMNLNYQELYSISDSDPETEVECRGSDDLDILSSPEVKELLSMKKFRSN